MCELSGYGITGKKNWLAVMLVFFLSSSLLVAQNVGINGSGNAPNASAMLDVTSGSGGTLGLLIPRMTQATRTGITTLPAAAQGLVVYQTDGLQGFYYNTSTTTTPSWVYLTPDAWSLTGNSGTTAGTNFIGTTDAIDFVLKTNNTERMRITSGGTIDMNVGRGDVYWENNSNDNANGAGITLRTSVNPSSGAIFSIRSSGQADRLWVGQSITSSGRNPFYVESNNNDGSLTADYGAKISGSTDSYFNLNGGNVGIATSSPAYPLDVTGQMRSTSLSGTGSRMVQADANGALTAMTAGTANQVLLGTGVWGNVPTNTAWSLTGNSGTTAGTDFLGTTDAQDMVIKTNGTERVRVLSNGDVGIGTSTPHELLELNGNIRGNQSGALRISTGYGYVDVGPQNTGWCHIYTDRPNFIFNKAVYSIGNAFSSYSTGNLYLQTGGTSRITALNSSGYVGVNTTTPVAQLQVAGAVLFNGGAANLDPGGSVGSASNMTTMLNNTANTLIGWNRSAGGGETDFISNRGAGGTGGFRFYDYTNTNVLNPLVTMKGNGQVGIGTTSPDASSVLDVSSSNKGVLLPQVALTSSTDATTVASPATGLLLYNTGTGGFTPAGYYYNSGTPSSPVWSAIGGSSSSSGSAPYFVTGSSTFTSSTTWTVPAGVTEVQVLMTGGGGGDGYDGSTETSGSNAGVVTGVLDVTPGETLTIHVGGGGTGYYSGWGNPGNGGGASYITNSSGTLLCMAGGGGGGASDGSTSGHGGGASFGTTTGSGQGGNGGSSSGGSGGANYTGWLKYAVSYRGKDDVDGGLVGSTPGVYSGSFTAFNAGNYGAGGAQTNWSNGAGGAVVLRW